MKHNTPDTVRIVRLLEHCLIAFRATAGILIAILAVLIVTCATITDLVNEQEKQPEAYDQTAQENLSNRSP